MNITGCNQSQYRFRCAGHLPTLTTMYLYSREDGGTPWWLQTAVFWLQGVCIQIPYILPSVWLLAPVPHLWSTFVTSKLTRSLTSTWEVRPCVNCHQVCCMSYCNTRYRSTVTTTRSSGNCVKDLIWWTYWSPYWAGLITFVITIKYNKYSKFRFRRLFSYFSFWIQKYWWTSSKRL